jgi:hypothetical protein
MQLDLALFLRLSRSLEPTESVGQAASDDQLDVLKALDRLFLTVGERMELLRTQDGVQPAELPEMPVAEMEPTKELPEEEEPPAVPADDEAPQIWTEQHDRLYEDVLWLFKMGDNEGALVSLGRLLDVAEDTPELQRFLDINEPKLVGLYERLIGAFDQPVKVPETGIGDRYFWNVQEAQALLRMGREAGSMAEILNRTALTRIKTLSLAHRFHREGLFVFQHAAKQAN